MAIGVYRLLLFLVFVFFSAGFTVDYWLLPQSFVNAGEDLLAEMTAGPAGEFTWLIMLIVAIRALGFLIAFVALIFMRHWARWMSIAMTVLSLALLPILNDVDVIVISGWAMLFYFLGMILWGTVLTLSFLPPIADHFVRTNPIKAIIRKAQDEYVNGNLPNLGQVLSNPTAVVTSILKKSSNEGAVKQTEDVAETDEVVENHLPVGPDSKEFEEGTRPTNQPVTENPKS